MKVLAIGATGFIGSHVARRLAEEGHDVAVFHRGRQEADLPDAVEHIHGDRNALKASKKEIERFAPEVVLDLVPYTEEQVRQVVEVFNGLTGRLVAVSSSDVYRNYDGWRGESSHVPDPAPLDEEAPLREKHYPYREYEGLDFEYAQDYDKIFVERAAMSAPALPGTMLRLPAVYGPGDTQHRLLPHLRRMRDERPAILMSEGQAQWHWTHGYVENVAAAIVRAVVDDRATGRVYNVGEEETPIEAERARQLGGVFGWTGEVRPLPEKRLPDALKTDFDWTYDLATDTRRIREELGYSEPVGREEALRRTIAWEEATPPEGTEEGPFDYTAEDEALEQSS